MRKELKNENSIYKEKIAKNLSNGTIVPVEITCSLIKNEINESLNDLKQIDFEKYKNYKTFMIDGFPRNKDNFSGYMEFLYNNVNTMCLLDFKIPNEEIFKRLSIRNREDDSKEVIKKRIDIYDQDTRIIINEFKKIGVSYVEINANKSIKEVFYNTMNILKYLF